MNKSIFLISVLTFLMVNVITAQDMSDDSANDKGFYAGVSLLGTSFEIPEIGEERDSGAGLGVQVGYNFNPNVGVFISLDGSNMSPDNDEEYALAHFDLGVEGRLNEFGDGFRPYGKAFFLGVAAAFDSPGGNVDISGTGFGVGLGVYYFFNQHFAVDVGYSHSFISFDELSIGSVSFEIDENETTGRLGLGLSYHF